MSETARPMAKPQIRNDRLHALLREATGIEPTWTSDARANPFGWLLLKRPEQMLDAAKALSGQVRLCTITAYAVARDDADRRRHIAYHFAAGDTVLTVTVPLFDPETLKKLPVPSITPWFRNADWNEREFREMYNIEVLNHPNPKRLFLDERLDAGIMTRLIPFSAMANSAGTNMLWERILEAKGVPPEDRRPSLAAPAEPIKVEPKVTPVAVPETRKKEPGSVTLADLAMPADDFAAARAREKAAVQEKEADATRGPVETKEQSLPGDEAKESPPEHKADEPTLEKNEAAAGGTPHAKAPTRSGKSPGKEKQYVRGTRKDTV